MYTSGFLCALGLFAVLQVPGTLGQEEDKGIPILLTNDDEDGIVAKHNKLRSSVFPTASNMRKMVWHVEAAENAQKWANKCVMGGENVHSRKFFRKLNDGTACGENLFMSTHGIEFDEIIQSWYDERFEWEYGKGPLHEAVVGHFTQLVWHDSYQIGCAAALCDVPDSDYRYIYVCHYCPQGNEQLREPYTKGETCAACPDECNDNLCIAASACEVPKEYASCPIFKSYCWWDYFAKVLCPITCKTIKPECE